MKFNEAKSGSLPGELVSRERQLVGEMLHPLPDSRPEAGDILALAWLEEAVLARPRRQRGDTVTLLDIMEEDADRAMMDSPFQVHTTWHHTQHHV